MYVSCIRPVTLISLESHKSPKDMEGKSLAMYIRDTPAFRLKKKVLLVVSMAVSYFLSRRVEKRNKSSSDIFPLNFHPEYQG